MIFDTIENKDNYKSFDLLYTALNYLSDMPKNELIPGSVTLIEDILLANPVKFISKQENVCLFEAHKRYIDLHYIVNGEEIISTANTSSLIQTTSYELEKDIAFYDGISDGKYLLKPGSFMVCWPNDAHKVGMMNNKPSEVQKIVFKIKVEESLI